MNLTKGTWNQVLGTENPQIMALRRFEYSEKEDRKQPCRLKIGEWRFRDCGLLDCRFGHPIDSRQSSFRTVFNLQSAVANVHRVESPA